LLRKNIFTIGLEFDAENKLNNLIIARNNKLLIPETIITTEKKVLSSFLKRTGLVITKNYSNNYYDLKNQGIVVVDSNYVKN